MEDKPINKPIKIKQCKVCHLKSPQVIFAQRRLTCNKCRNKQHKEYYRNNKVI